MLYLSYNRYYIDSSAIRPEPPAIGFCLPRDVEIVWKRYSQFRVKPPQVYSLRDAVHRTSCIRMDIGFYKYMEIIYKGPYERPYLGSMSFWPTNKIDRSSLGTQNT